MEIRNKTVFSGGKLKMGFPTLHSEDHWRGKYKLAVDTFRGFPPR